MCESSQDTKKRANVHSVVDMLGVCASSLCAVHCFLMPIIITVLPMCGRRFLQEGEIHPTLAFFVVTLGLVSIVPGYLQHGKCAVLQLMLSGLSLVLLATFVIEPRLGETWELLIITVGNAMVISAHLINQRQLRLCNSPGKLVRRIV